MTQRGAHRAGVRVVERETVRTARYALVGADPAAASRVWFVLHGYGQLATRFIGGFADVVPADTCIVAPEGLSRFYRDQPQLDGSHLQRVGATWMTRESRETEITDAIRWLDVVHGDVLSSRAGASPACGVLGFSQGVATAMRWIANGAVQPRTFVAWAGGLASDVQHELFKRKVADADVVLVAGDQDGFASPEARTAVSAEMRRHHPTPRELSFSGAHHLDPGVLQMLLDEFPRRG